MITLNTLLMILALICFVIGAISWPVPRVNVTALGLAFWILSILIRTTP